MSKGTGGYVSFHLESVSFGCLLWQNLLGVAKET